jgi:excisionase family DNA binding protein
MLAKKKRRRVSTAKRPTVVPEPSPPRYDELADMVTPEEVGAFLRTSRNATYELLKSGALRSVRCGRLIRIPKAALMGQQPM